MHDRPFCLNQLHKQIIVDQRECPNYQAPRAAKTKASNNDTRYNTRKEIRAGAATSGSYASTSIRSCSSCIAPTRQQRNIRTTQNPGSIIRNLAAYQAEKRHAEVRNTPLRTTGTPLLTNENWLFDHMPRHRGGARRACSSFSQIEPYDGFAAGGRFRNWPERMAVHHLKRQAQLPI